MCRSAEKKKRVKFLALIINIYYFYIYVFYVNLYICDFSSDDTLFENVFEIPIIDTFSKNIIHIFLLFLKHFFDDCNAPISSPCRYFRPVVLKSKTFSRFLSFILFCLFKLKINWEKITVREFNFRRFLDRFGHKKKYDRYDEWRFTNLWSDFPLQWFIVVFSMST